MMARMSEQIHIQAVMLSDDGTFPNNPKLPLLVYPGAFLPFGKDRAAEIETRFGGNGWRGMWRNGIYSRHHYHSEAHEALGVYRGTAKVQFGGPNGPVIEVKAGDAVVLPAGTSHKLIEATSSFAVVGAYPPGQQPDLCFGKPEERPGAHDRIAVVPIPHTDPVLGPKGGLIDTWGGTILSGGSAESGAAVAQKAVPRHA